MIVVINTKKLQDAMAIIKGGLEGMTVQTKSLMLNAIDNSLYLSANSGKIAVDIELKNIEESTDGKVIVDGKYFYDIISAAQSPLLRIEYTGKFLIVYDDSRKTKMATLDDQFFVPCSANNLNVIGTVDIGLLTRLLSSATHVADPNNEIFCGIMITKDLIMSSNREAICAIPFECDLEQDILVTKEFCKQLQAMKISGDVELRSDGRFIGMFFDSEEDSVVLNSLLLLPDQYPDIRNLVINRFKFNSNMLFELDTIVSELEYVGLVSKNKEQRVDMTYTKGDESVKLSATANQGTNLAETHIPFDMLDSSPFDHLEYKFNLAGINSVVKALKGSLNSDIIIEYNNDGKSPCKFDALDITCFLMPKKY